MELKTVTVGKDKEQLLADFTMYGVTVPAGFIFDGASSPRILWWLIPPFKGTKKSACLHDYLCKIAKNKEDRKEADKLFYRGLKETSGFNSIRCLLGYLGVRVGAYLGIGVYYD